MLKIAYQTFQFHKLKPCRYGKMLYNENDTLVGYSLDRYGEWAQEEINLLSRFISPGEVVLDIGAYIGPHTMFFSSAVGPSGLVYAFEPHRIFFQMLCCNTALNNRANTRCHPMAIGGQNGFVTTAIPDFTLSHAFSTLPLNVADGEPAAMMMLDSIPLSACHFIRIASGTMALEILQGGIRTLKAFYPGLYIEKPEDPGQDAALRQKLTDLGYRIYLHRPPYFNPQNYARHETNIFGDAVSNHYFCLSEQSPILRDPVTSVLLDSLM